MLISDAPGAPASASPKIATSPVGLNGKPPPRSILVFEYAPGLYIVAPLKLTLIAILTPYIKPYFVNLLFVHGDKLVSLRAVSINNLTMSYHP
jgi:hypothetical protein